MAQGCHIIGGRWPQRHKGAAATQGVTYAAGGRSGTRISQICGRWPQWHKGATVALSVTHAVGGRGIKKYHEVRGR